MEKKDVMRMTGTLRLESSEADHQALAFHLDNLFGKRNWKLAKQGSRPADDERKGYNFIEVEVVV